MITSIEYDHADIYEDLERIKREFGKFVQLIPQHGLLVACVDDPNVREVIASATVPLQTYGYATDAEWTISDIVTNSSQTQFTVQRRGQTFATLHTSLIGRHNLLNLLGATVILHHLGLTPLEIDAGFSTFQGVKRRQEVRGIVKDIVVIDDFAHHPTAVKATIEAVKTHYQGRKVWSVFEPRTAATRRDVFQQDFVAAFLETDVVILADVHRPDKAPEGHRLSTDQLVKDLRQHNVEALHISGVENIVKYSAEHLVRGDIVLIMSNGGFGGIHDKLLKALQQKNDSEKHRI